MARDIFGSASVLLQQDGQDQFIPILPAETGESWVESKDLDFGASGQDKYVDRILFDMEFTGIESPIEVQLGIRDRLRDPIDWQDSQRLTGESPWYDARVTAKFFRLRVRTTLSLSRPGISRVEFYGRGMQGRF